MRKKKMPVSRAARSLIELLEVRTLLSSEIVGPPALFENTYTQAIGGFDSMVSADFNGDGKADLAGAMYDSEADEGSIVLFDGTGDAKGSFEAPVTILPAGEVLNIHPQSLVTADFNGDGKADLAFIDQQTHSVMVLMGNGNGTFVPPQLYIVDFYANLLVAGNTGGGGIDLITGGQMGGALQVLENTGGTFNRRTLSFSASISAIAVGDVIGDSTPEIIVANSEGGLTLYSRSVDGFYSIGTVSGPPGIKGLAVGDFNEDGNNEVAVVAQGGGESPGALLLYGQGVTDAAAKAGRSLWSRWICSTAWISPPIREACTPATSTMTGTSIWHTPTMCRDGWSLRSATARDRFPSWTSPTRARRTPWRPAGSTAIL